MNLDFFPGMYPDSRETDLFLKRGLLFQNSLKILAGPVFQPEKKDNSFFLKGLPSIPQNLLPQQIVKAYRQHFQILYIQEEWKCFWKDQRRPSRFSSPETHSAAMVPSPSGAHGGGWEGLGSDGGEPSPQKTISS